MKQRKLTSLVSVFILLVISCAWIPDLFGDNKQEPVVIDLGGGSGIGQDELDLSVEQVAVSIPKTTKILQAGDFDQLATVSSDLTLYFSSEVESIADLDVGDVLISESTDKFPEGFIRLVKNIDQAADQIVIETEAGTIESAIESGTVEIQGMLEYDEVIPEPEAESRNNGGVLMMPLQQGFHIIIDDEILYDRDNDITTTYDQIVANGNILLEPGFDFRMTIKKHSITELVFTTETVEQISLEVNSFVEIDNLSESQEIARYRFSPFTVWVGWVPVVITPIMTVDVGLNGDASVNITSGFSQTARLTAGLSYRNANWGPVQDFSNDIDFTPPMLKSACELKSFIEPRLDLRIYGVPGPYMRAQAYLLLEADPNSSPWWELSSGLESQVGVEFESLSDYIDPYRQTVIEEKWTLAQAKSAFVEATSPPTSTRIPTDIPTLTSTSTSTLVPSLTPEPETTSLSEDYDWIDYGDRVNSYLEDEDDELFWFFEGEEGDDVTISAWKETDELDTILTLYDDEKEEITYNDDFSDGKDSKIESYSLPYSGQYIIGVSAYDGSGEFGLSLEAIGVATPEVGEANIQNIVYGETVDGYLDEDEYELWTFSGTEGDVITITMKSVEGEDGDLDSQIFLSEGTLDNEIRENDDADFEYYYDAQIGSFSLPSSTKFFIKAFARSGSGDYTLKLEGSSEQSHVQTKGIFKVSILPPNPSPGEGYVVLIETTPPESGIEITIEIHGSDNYDYYSSGKTDSEGIISFPTDSEEISQIPGAEESGIVETIYVYAPELEQEETFEFIFE